MSMVRCDNILYLKRVTPHFRHFGIMGTYLFTSTQWYWTALKIILLIKRKLKAYNSNKTNYRYF